MSPTELIREALRVRCTSEGLNRTSHSIGVDPAAASRFIRQKQQFTTGEQFDRLLDGLGLEIRKQKEKRT